MNEQFQSRLKPTFSRNPSHHRPTPVLFSSRKLLVLEDPQGPLQVLVLIIVFGPQVLVLVFVLKP